MRQQAVARDDLQPLQTIGFVHLKRCRGKLDRIDKMNRMGHLEQDVAGAFRDRDHVDPVNPVKDFPKYQEDGDGRS